MPSYNKKINLTPYWSENKPNIILVAQYYTTTGHTFSAKITGPGLPTNGISFLNNDAKTIIQQLSGITYKTGETLQYNLDITSNSTTLAMQVQNSTTIGQKPDGDTISYQACFFSNDAGHDKDWNDCVITLSLFNNSTD
jgi:hypothetical protein